ncbi:MFS transporter [Halegenticoccus tardaugens]|uniref:MFS transporter n=1 Tax=Halegenticoccus tardaugens TaxID=2071624 RepID=UPI00100BFEF8|nr:MFS transporter [Halegenticoccus tardaugens]
MTRRLFGTLCGLVFLVNFGRTAFAPLIETFETTFGVGPAAVGVVTTLVWVGTAVPRIPVGYLLTRVPRHLVVLGTGALLAAAAGFTASSTSLSTLCVGAFAIGVASGAYFVAAVPLVGELYPEALGRAIGVHGTASQLAAVAAPPAVVFALGAHSWRAVFWFLAVAAALLTVAMVVVLRSRRGIPSSSVGVDRDFLGALAHWRLILVGLLMISAFGFVWQGLFNFYVSYLVESKGLSTSAAGTLLTVVFAAGVPAFWVSGRFVDRFPHVPYILAIHAAFIACLVALTAVSSFLAVAVVTAALGYAIHSLFPALDTYLLESLPDANRGAAYAVFSGLSLLIEANGSGAVGALRGSGLAFEAIFRAFAVGLIVVFAVVAGLYLAGRLEADRLARTAPGVDP